MVAALANASRQNTAGHSLVRDISRPALPLVFADAFPICNLSCEDQRVAARALEVYGHDERWKTISLADIELAREDARFSPEEAQMFSALEFKLRAAREKTPTSIAARVSVPMPGEHTVVLAESDDFELTIVSTTQIVERRRHPVHSVDPDPIVTNFELNRHHELWINVSRESCVTLTHSLEKVPNVYGPGAHHIHLRPGQYTVDTGDSAMLLSIPPLPAAEQVDLRPYSDYTLYADGKRLYRAPRIAHIDRAREISVVFDYTDTRLPSPVSHELVEAVTTPRVSIPFGRYKLDDNLELDLYPGGAVVLDDDGQRVTLSLRADGVYRSESYEYDPTRNKVRIGSTVVCTVGLLNRIG